MVTSIPAGPEVGLIDTTVWAGGGGGLLSSEHAPRHAAQRASNNEGIFWHFITKTFSAKIDRTIGGGLSNL